MQPLTPKQKKSAWIVVAILLTIHFLPGIVRSVSQSWAIHRQAALAAQRKALPVTQAPPPQLAPAPPVAPALSPALAGMYLGTWEGTQLLPAYEGDQCHVRLEIRLSPDHPGKLSGYESRSCFNIPGLSAPKAPGKNGLAEAIRDASPVSTVMLGAADGDNIAFEVDQTIGSSPFVCPMVSYRTSSFGAKSIVAQWRAVDCAAGSMVLTRTGG